MKKLACFVMSFVMFLSVMPANVAWAEEMDNEESTVCEHQLEFTSVLKEASCTAAGIGKAVCTICGESLGYQSIPMLEHAFEEYEVVVEATCEGNAVERAECNYGCGMTEEREVQESALGHCWDDGTITVEKTCTEDQVKVYNCTRCEASYTETEESIGHQYTVTEHKDATCSEDGKDIYTCSECGDTYEEVIPGVGVVDHIPGNDEYVPATCEECGKAVTYCTVCHELLNEELLGELDPALGHNYVNNICTRCGEEYYIEDPNLVTSIEVAPVEIVEGTNGELVYYLDNEGIQHYWWYYGAIKPDNITLTYQDGHTITRKPELNEYSTFSLGQSYESPMTVGTYIATIYVEGQNISYPVNIVETPVESLVFDGPVTGVEGLNAYYTSDYPSDQRYLYYSIQLPEYVTIHYKDGTELYCKTSELDQLTGNKCYIQHKQSYTNQFHAGENEVEVYYMGVTGTFKFILEENPVDHVDLDPLELLDIRYYEVAKQLHNLTGTICLKDGSEFNGKIYDYLYQNGAIKYLSGWDEFLYDETTHIITISILGYMATTEAVQSQKRLVSFEVEEQTVYAGAEPKLIGTFHYSDGSIEKRSDKYLSVMESVPKTPGDYEITVMHVLTELRSSMILHVTDENPIEYIDFDTPIIDLYMNPAIVPYPSGTIHYKDGSSQYIRLGVLMENNSCYIDPRLESVGFSVSTNVDTDSVEPGNTYLAVLNLFGAEYTFSFEVIDTTPTFMDEYRSVSLSGDDELIFSCVKINGEIETMTALRYDFDDSVIVTDKESFHIAWATPEAIYPRTRNGIDGAI